MDNIEVLLGKTLKNVTKTVNEYYEDEILFETIDGEKYKMYHEQNCCERVTIEEIIGDLEDLIGSTITMAEEITQEGEETDEGISRWTFYKFATVKGYVTIRWYGESNGYYSVSVDFEKMEDED